MLQQFSQLGVQQHYHIASQNGKSVVPNLSNVSLLLPLADAVYMREKVHRSPFHSDVDRLHLPGDLASDVTQDKQRYAGSSFKTGRHIVDTGILPDSLKVTEGSEARTVRKHVRVLKEQHALAVWPCPFCARIFASETSLLGHFQWSHGTSGAEYTGHHVAQNYSSDFAPTR